MLTSTCCVHYHSDGTLAVSTLYAVSDDLDHNASFVYNVVSSAPFQGRIQAFIIPSMENPAQIAFDVCSS